MGFRDLVLEDRVGVMWIVLVLLVARQMVLVLNVVVMEDLEQ
jgi:hypothetical protein